MERVLVSCTIHDERNTFLSIKTTGYRVKLHETIDSEGEWEVGVYSVFYPHTWYTLQDRENHVYYSTGLYFTTTNNNVEYGYYETMEDFMKPFNVALETENVALITNPRLRLTRSTHEYV